MQHTPTSPGRSRAELLLGLVLAATVVWGTVWGFGPGQDSSDPAAGAEQHTAPVPLSRLHTHPAALTGSPIFADDFDGAAGSPASPANWRPSVSGDGFGNHELECATDDRRTSALDGQGRLVITAYHTPGFTCPDGQVTNFESARLTGLGLKAQTYGRLRVRASLPTASGTWPAIWALGTDNPQVGWPDSGEIDVAEVVGSAPTTLYQTLHGPVGDGSAWALQSATRLPLPPSDGFHVYGVDWTPNSITFSVDDRVTGSFSKAEVSSRGAWVFDKPFYLLLDLAVGGDFPGPPEDPSVFPQRMLVDYVRLYR